MTFEYGPRILQVLLGMGLGGGDAVKGFVEEGDDALLFGDWRNRYRHLSQLAPADALSRSARRFSINCAEIVARLRVIVKKLWQCLLCIEPNNRAVNCCDHPLSSIRKNAASPRWIG